MRTEILFIVFPYAAVALLVVGLAARIFIERTDIDAARAEVQATWQRYRGGRVWRAALLLLAAGHIVGLLLPSSILAWNAEPLRLYVLEGSGVLLGLVALAGWGQVMWRHLGQHHGSKISEIADCVFLSLFFVAVGSGLLTALGYRWGSSWAGVTLTPYLRSLVFGDPLTSFADQMPVVVQLHILTLFGLLAVLPFTRLALFPVVAIDGIIGLAGRPLAAAGRAGQRAVDRLAPSRWLWPEEDLVAAGSVPPVDGDSDPEGSADSPLAGFSPKAIAHAGESKPPRAAT